MERQEIVMFAVEKGEKKGGGRFRRRQQLTALSLGLGVLKKTVTKIEDVEVKREQIEQVVETVFKALPAYVTSVQVENEIFTRDQESMGKIPQERQRQWNLEDVDQYAASRARSAGVRWDRKFPPSQGS